jgi:polysaccharide pyruvyl transferase WcaK-like protein
MILIIRKIKLELLWLIKFIRYYLKTKNRAIYIGCSGNKNLGDEIIFDSIKEFFKDELFLVRFPHVNKNLGSYFRSKIKNPDFIILGGGTLIRKGYNQGYLKNLNETINKFPDSKLLVIGPGVSDPIFSKSINFPTNIEGWTKTLITSLYLSVRGPRSLATLNKWGLENVVEFKDPALSLFRSNKIIKKPRSKKIAINFANIGERIYGGNSKKLKTIYFDFVELLIINKWEVYLYPTTYYDLDYMLNDIGLSSLKGIEKFHSYNNINLYVGERLHGVLFSACVSTPFFGLAYQPKTLDFLDSINLTEFCEKVDRIELFSLFDKINEIYKDKISVQNLIFNNMKLATTIQSREIEKIKKILSL